MRGKSITYQQLGKRPLKTTAFVVLAALAALLTMATALSVTDFLQLIFPQAGSSFSLGASPVERLLSNVYLYLVKQGPMRALVLYALLLFVVYGLKNVCSYLSVVTFSGLKIDILRELRDRLHVAALSQPFAGWSSQAQGQWLSRITVDIAEYEANMLDSLKSLVTAVITMTVYVVTLFYLDWRLTLMVMVVMAVGTMLLSASRKLKRQSRLLQSLGGELMTTTQETIDSLKEIKAATAIDYVNDRHREQNSDYTHRRISLYRRIYAASPLSDFMGNTIVAAILIIGAHRVLGEAASLSPALFVSYIMIYVLLLTPIKDFSNAISQMKKGSGVEDRMAEVLSNTQSDAPTQYGTNMPTPLRTNASSPLELRDVSFSYGTQKVISHLNMAVPSKCHTAVVGPSGTGKTTLGRLIVGLLEPSEGDVLLDGKPCNADQRRGRIAYIPQEPMLFNDTVESNIRFGRDWLTDDDIRAAARVAQVEPILATLPEGLQTVIGDGGGRLSGGERQRINIARALAGNPDIIVMDEATAALDAATEQHFSDQLREIMGGQTVVVIAHRASTIARCDHVFSMEKGAFTR